MSSKRVILMIIFFINNKKPCILTIAIVNKVSEEKTMYIDPKKRFVKYLKTLLDDTKKKCKDIIFTGDFNEGMNYNPNDLTQPMLDM